MKKILNLIALILSIVLAAGVKLWFHACAKMEDGTWMHCHDAENAVFAAGIALAVLLLLMLLLKNRKAAAVIGFLVTAGAIVTALLPQTIIHMCMMETMRCQSVMKPAVFLIAGAVALLSLIAAILHLTSKEFA